VSDEYLVPRGSFAPLSRTGLLFGLSKTQLIVAAIAVARPVLQIVLLRNIAGGLYSLIWWTLPLAVLAVGSYRGRSYLSMVLITGTFFLRKIGRQTFAVPNLRVKHDDMAIEMPGPWRERSKILPMLNVSYLPAGAAFIYDRSKDNPTATAVLRVETEAWLFADEQAKAARIQAVSDMCKELAATVGIERVALLARTYAGSSKLLPKPKLYAEDSYVGEFARADYAEMMATTKMGASLHRDVLIAITLSLKKAGPEIAAEGGQVAGVSKVLATKVRRVVEMLPACGVRSEDLTVRSRWLSAGEIRGAIKLALAPDAAGFLEQNGWSVPAGTMLQTYAKERLDYLITDGGFHRAWWIDQWPAVDATAGFLYPLVAQGETPHTFTQVWQPVDLYDSEKRWHNDVMSRETSAALQQALGRPTSTTHRAEGADMGLRFQEMQLGYGDVNYSGWLVVHANTMEELNKSNSWVKQSTVGMRIGLARGRQLATFNTAALPLGYRDEAA